MVAQVNSSKQATQPSIQWSSCILPLGVKQPGPDVYHSALANEV